jgi:hypothetical protein
VRQLWELGDDCRQATQLVVLHPQGAGKDQAVKAFWQVSEVVAAAGAELAVNQSVVMGAKCMCPCDFLANIPLNKHPVVPLD